MKRNWIWGLCATMIAGGAFAFAQQEGGSAAPAATPSSGTTAPAQEASPAATASAPAGTIDPNAPSAGVTSAAASSDPFGGQPASAQAGFGGQSSNPFGAAPTTTDSAPAQNGSRNFGSGFGGGKGGASGFGAMGGGFGQQGNAFGGQVGRGSGAFAGGGLGGGMTMAGQNMSNMMLSKEAREYRDAENSVIQIAVRFRHIAKDDPAADKLKEELKVAVTKAFEARQAQQAAEVKRLKEKLAEIEATVTRREKIKEDLILERISDLTTGGGDFSGGVSGNNLFGTGVFPMIPSSNGLPVDAPSKSNNAPPSLQIR